MDGSQTCNYDDESIVSERVKFSNMKELKNAIDEAFKFSLDQTKNNGKLSKSEKKQKKPKKKSTAKIGKGPKYRTLFDANQGSVEVDYSGKVIDQELVELNKAEEDKVKVFSRNLKVY